MRYRAAPPSRHPERTADDHPPPPPAAPNAPAADAPHRPGTGTRGRRPTRGRRRSRAKGAHNRNLGVRWTHRGNRSRRAGCAGDGLPRSAVVHRRLRGEKGRPAVYAGAGAIPGRPRCQGRHGAADPGSARQRHTGFQSCVVAAEDTGRAAISGGRCARNDAVGCRAGAERRGAATSVADQSGLHRNPRADQRQDRAHHGHHRECGVTQFGRAGDHHQPGPDVRGVPGRAAHRAGPPRPLRKGGRVQRGGDQTASGQRTYLQPDRQAQLLRQHGIADHRHHHAARFGRQSAVE